MQMVMIANMRGGQLVTRYYIDDPRIRASIDNWWDVDVMPSMLIVDAPYSRNESRRDFWKLQGDIMGSAS